MVFTAAIMMVCGLEHVPINNTLGVCEVAPTLMS